MAVRFVSPEETLVLNRDAIFHVLMGSDQRLVCEANKHSADRVAAYTKTDSAMHLIAQGSRSITQAKAIFIVLLHVDPVLRQEVIQGTALTVKTKPMCEYKAVQLFASLYDNVLCNWLKTDLDTPLDLVDVFESEYLVS